MTVVFIDPIHGAALTAGLLPILPGLPCPTCGGKRGRYVHAPPYPDDPDGLRWVVCPDCTDGVWTPPGHPVTIGVTSAEPVRVGRLGPQGPAVTAIRREAT